MFEDLEHFFGLERNTDFCILITSVIGDPAQLSHIIHNFIFEFFELLVSEFLFYSIVLNCLTLSVCISIFSTCFFI